MTQSFSKHHILVLVVVLALLVAVVLSLIHMFRDTSIPVAEKVVWAVILILFPVLGLVIWVGYSFLRRRSKPPRVLG